MHSALKLLRQFSISTGQTSGRAATSKLHAASELWQTTGRQVYKDYLLSNEALIVKEFRSIGWLMSGPLIKAGSDELITVVEESCNDIFGRDQEARGTDTLWSALPSEYLGRRLGHSELRCEAILSSQGVS